MTNYTEKRTCEAFGKKIYLLGKDKDGVNYWLEAPSWSCDWYWGFGYVETYTNNENPSKARDINTHQHFCSLFFEKNKNGYDAFKNFFKDITVSDKELWQLLELMKTFYSLKEAAEVLGRGGAHYATNLCAEIIKNESEVTRINEVVLPAIFTEIDNLLSA
jgi:hypothetical protein